MRSKNAVPSKAAPPKHRTAAKRTADQGIFGEGRRNCIENNKDNFMSCTHFTLYEYRTCINDGLHRTEEAIILFTKHNHNQLWY